jgi:hypothetical protein
MTLASNNGKLILREGKLGTGNGCCCGTPPPPPDVCTVPCYQGFDPCPPGCVCCGGKCVREITCEMPTQITMSLSGMKRLFLWGSQNGGTPTYPFFCQLNGQGQPEIFDKIFCNQCAEPEAYLRQGGTSSGIFGYVGSLITQNFSNVVLDRISEDSCGMVYRGVIPQPPQSSAYIGYPRVVDCDPGDSIVQVFISPIDAGVDVSFQAPQFGGETATATATVGNGGQISGLTITNGGSGYAREIMTRSEPTITASITGGTGSGATLSVTLAQDGEGAQATWSVTSVSVTNGGTGYNGAGYVTFTPGAGTTTAGGAWAQLIVGRVAPTVTASASSGSGATLTVTLTQGFDWFTNQPYWYVDSVAVTNGGSGYEDGEHVSFTVTDGESQYAATATISAPSGEIESVYVYNGGAYFKSTGVVESVQVYNGGSYYVEQGTGNADVHTPAITIISNTGTGATATATVDGTVGSATFGKVTSVTVNNGGQNYYATGSAWLVSIGGLFHHLQAISIANPTQAPHGRLLPIAGRVSRQACPTELLNRSYTMWTAENDPFQERLPEGFADYVVNEGGYSLTVFGFSGAITVSLSAG